MGNTMSLQPLVSVDCDMRLLWASAKLLADSFVTGLEGKNQGHSDIDLNIELIHIRGTRNATTPVTFNKGNL